MTITHPAAIVAFLGLAAFASAQQSNPEPCKVGDRYVAKGLVGQVRSVWVDQIRVQPDGAEPYDQVIVPLPLGSGRYRWPPPTAPAYGTAKPTPSPTAESVAPDPAARCVPKEPIANQVSVPLGPGIEPLTEELLKTALTVSTDDLARASNPLLAKLSVAIARGILRDSDIPKDPPFSVAISSPWTRAAFTSAEARRKYQWT